MAVLRSLLGKDWQEEGVHWALIYLHNRLVSVRNYQRARDELLGIHRKRSSSLPAPRVQVSEWDSAPGGGGTYGAGISSGSKTDLDISDGTKQPTWAQLNNFTEEENKPSPGSLASTVDKALTATTALLFSKSQTDSQISYIAEYAGEAVGSLPYIGRSGELKLSAILLSLVPVLDECTSLRVCEASLNLLHLLLDMEVLSPANEADAPGGTDTSPSPAKSPQSPAPTISRTDDQLTGKSGTRAEEVKAENPATSVPRTFALVLQAVHKAFLFLGCPQGCQDSLRSPQADFLRAQAKSCLARLHKTDSVALSQWLLALVKAGNLHPLIDFLHALTGFCSEGSHAPHLGTGAGTTRPRSLSYLRSKSPEGTSTGQANYRLVLDFLVV